MSPLPGSGPISLNDVQTEFGGSNPIGINEYYGVAGGVPSSGTISLADFYGTSAFSGDVVFVKSVTSSNSSANYVAYPFSSVTGFGTKYANPSFSGHGGQAIARNSSGTRFVTAITGGTSTTIPTEAFSYTPGSGFGSKLTSTPAEAIQMYTFSVAITPNGTDAFWAGSSAPMYRAAAFSSSGWGSYKTNPISTTTYTEIALSPSGNAVVFGSNTNGYLKAYRYTQGTGWGSAYAAAPSIPSSGMGELIVFKPSGTAIIVCSVSSPYIHAWSWSDSTGFGSKYANPTTLPTSRPACVSWHPDGDRVVCGSVMYAWSDSTGFGSVLQTGIPTGSRSSFSPDGSCYMTGKNIYRVSNKLISTAYTLPAELSAAGNWVGLFV